MKLKEPRSGFFLMRGYDGFYSPGTWSWHLKSSNGRIIAANTGFNSKANALKCIKAVMRMMKVKTPQRVYDIFNKRFTTLKP